MKVKITADAEFEANSLEDALSKLAAHFAHEARRAAGGHDAPAILTPDEGGSIEVSEVE